MEWTQQMLARYLGRVRLDVEFQGITDQGLQAAFRQEAVRRLAAVEAIVFEDEAADSEKVQALKELLQA